MEQLKESVGNLADAGWRSFRAWRKRSTGKYRRTKKVMAITALGAIACVILDLSKGGTQPFTAAFSGALLALMTLAILSPYFAFKAWKNRRVIRAAE
jgi:hypothetical protein